MVSERLYPRREYYFAITMDPTSMVSGKENHYIPKLKEYYITAFTQISMFV